MRGLLQITLKLSCLPALFTVTFWVTHKSAAIQREPIQKEGKRAKTRRVIKSKRVLGVAAVMSATDLSRRFLVAQRGFPHQVPDQQVAGAARHQHAHAAEAHRHLHIHALHHNTMNHRNTTPHLTAHCSLYLRANIISLSTN